MKRRARVLPFLEKGEREAGSAEAKALTAVVLRLGEAAGHGPVQRDPVARVARA